MNVKSGYPFWAIKNGLISAFPPITRDQTCDVVVIGGGITGALIADELTAHDHDVILLEQRDIGWGSTSASTALLQFEIDTHMIDLARRFDEDTAALAYRACAEAIPMLRTLAREVRDVEFATTDSLYVASTRKDVAVLEAELAMRQRHGLPGEWLDSDDVLDRYGFAAHGAILSDLGATVDPYRFAWRLLARIQRRGAGVFDRTEVSRIEATTRSVTAVTSLGVTVHAKHVVFATGYEGQRWLAQRVARNRSSYACVSDSLEPTLLGPLAQTMIWESARPYFYLRTTGDHRILVGGEDDAVDIPAKRDARVARRARRLCDRVDEMFPDLQMVPAFAWAGTFAETEDGLPFFGSHAQHGPRAQFAMAYGGNGITYAMLGAGVIRAAIERRPHELASLMSFARLEM